MSNFYNTQHTCSECKKDFLATAEWTYRENGKWQCGWKCYLAAKRIDRNGIPVSRKKRCSNCGHKKAYGAEACTGLESDAGCEYWARRVKGG